MANRGLLIFDAPDGTYRVYDSVKDHFACFTSAGLICTLFRLRTHNLSAGQIATFLASQGMPIDAIPNPAPPSKRPSIECENTCPVCGFGFVGRPPYVDRFGSFDICPCCGFEYGFHDHVLGETFESWRSKWIEGGANWPVRDYATEPPGWDAATQLRNIDVDLTKYRKR